MASSADHRARYLCVDSVVGFRCRRALTYKKVRLKDDPNTNNASQIASDMVKIAGTIDGIRLPFSASYLQYVDVKIDEFRTVGYSADDIEDALLGFGCYAGEVFVRQAKGKWRRPEDLPNAPKTDSSVVIALENGKVCDPIATVFKRMEEGPPAGLHALYLSCTAP